MVKDKVKEKLEKQHYSVVGDHSAVQICGWTKNSLRDEGSCYKQKFYGIKSHKCCQMSPNIYCPNRCIHCWRPMQIMDKDKEKENKPEEIIEGAIKAQRKLLSGFKGSDKTNMNKFEEAQEPDQFAISLIGEPTNYSKIGKLIEELRNRGKSTFLVTNGLFPSKLEKLEKNNRLPTQIYISLNSPNKERYKKWHNSKMEGAWEKFNRSLEIMKDLNTRTVVRMTLVRDKNMVEPESYSELIKKADPDFVEVKSFMSVGFSRKRLGYDRMPSHEETKEFAKKLLEFLPEYNLLDEHKRSRVVLLGKDKSKMKIREEEI